MATGVQTVIPGRGPIKNIEVEVNPLSPITVTVETLEELAGDVLKQDFGEVLLVAPSTETTLASLTVATGKILRLRGVFGEGKVDGIFRLFVDSTKRWQSRNAWTDRNVNGIIEVDATAGQIITLKVIHSNALSKPFSGSIYAYERSI